MATQSPFPFSLLESIATRLGARLQPPDWLIQEAQRRMVLTVNHVLQQEPEAQARLARQAGRVVEARWRSFVVRLAATPAGLLELATSAAPADLTLTMTDESPWTLAQAALRGGKPPVQIIGDVQFAAEINWLVDHVRWDAEEDLSRLVGDAPAHAAMQAFRRVAAALRAFGAGPSTLETKDTSASAGQAGA